ncbi:hypothetical protein [Kosakonia cowanii]|uniref:hypothetical protein n=1 Tax=Kosakonia cowanii TaxID=208223 RepID=UPI0028A04CA9|nr:hypothetical protein [Kosakonia cowanii]
MKSSLKAMLIAVALASVSVHAGTIIYRDGRNTYVDTGKGTTTYREIEGRVYGDDGSTTYQIGNTTYSDDKNGHSTSYFEAGGITFGSDGSRKQTIGKYTYITDANGKTQTCFDEGPRTFCN